MLDVIDGIITDIKNKAIEIGQGIAKIAEILNPVNHAKYNSTFILKETLDQKRKIPGTPQNSSNSWSFAAGIDYKKRSNHEKHAELFGLKDTGKQFYFYLKNDGTSHWKINGKTPKTGSRFGGSKALSYNRKRKGEYVDLPAFDMIASSADRVIAKAKDTDVYFMAIPTEVYYHKTDKGKFLKLRQSLFKLDPELYKTNSINDIINTLTIKDDDYEHLATVRFPFFKGIFKAFNDTFLKVILTWFTLNFPLPIVIGSFAATSTENFTQHLFDQIPVTIPPFIWIEIDTRPFMQSKPFNKKFTDRYKVYTHVHYREDDGPLKFDEYRKSIAYHKVLSIGVGLSHLHEQYEAIYGGEIDALQNDEIMLGNSHDTWYRFANGQFRDAGGWIDGTCIYYLLVQNKHIRDVPKRTTDPNSKWKNVYSVLWADEQFGFTERWRSAEIEDNEFSTPLSVYHLLKVGKYQDKITEASFFSPFKEGLIRTFSRMTVARQIVVVNGFDSRTKQHELYTYHLAWGNIDTRWRKRVLDFAPTSRKEHFSRAKTSYFIPSRVSIREDMTISIEGGKIIDGKLIKGFWVQKYLPADNVERDTYNHHWDFLSENAFNFRNTLFSHFGVLSKVSSRIQFYETRFPTREDATVVKNHFSASFLDKQNEFMPETDQLQWREAGKRLTSMTGSGTWEFVQGFFGGLLGIFTDPGQTFRDFQNYFSERDISKPNRKPIFSKYLRLQFTDAGHFGVIATHFDKREDKNVTMDRYKNGRLKKVRLELEANPGNTKVSVSLKRHWYNFPGFPAPAQTPMSPPEVEFTTLVVVEQKESCILNIWIGCARDITLKNIETFDSKYGKRIVASNAKKGEHYKRWLKANLFKMHIGIRRGAKVHTITETLHDAIDSGGRNIRSNAPHSSLNRPLFMFNVQIKVGKFYGKILKHHLTENNRVMHGHSIWFEGVTGLVNIAAKTAFEKHPFKK
ncbi:hypothetical protein KORDIASMS9_00877 [Kordia sp. SMS9]|uniref:hypothetical protein n=1 Tax=Kordia sp. SMS9 TaxID=2282170 RepID=UPI000E0DBBFF|nr:hypothetical protein [Kordia sp. SMS9]AXG68661.1 hypothetical protein KORDIASMS9_00877 [Kordia sp. SMS9]